MSIERIDTYLKKRSSDCFHETPDLLLDYSRQNLSDSILTSFENRFKQNTHGRIIDMFAGEKINFTEKRQVLHYLNRWPSDDRVNLGEWMAHPSVKKSDKKEDLLTSYDQIQEVSKKVHSFVDHVRSEDFKLASGKSVKHIISVGIGGSFLGTKSVYDSIKEHPKYRQLAGDMKLHFIANVDPMSVFKVMSAVDVESTLVVVISKSFSTQETLQNMDLTLKWMMKYYKDKESKLTEGQILNGHFAVVTANADKAMKKNISEKNIFGMFGHTGGRFSVSSAVGTLPLGLIFGNDTIRELLKGMHDMDRNFFGFEERDNAKYVNPCIRRNLGAMLGFIDFFQINSQGYSAKTIIPYNDELGAFIGHLQQLEMESSGKHKDLTPEKQSASQVVFGDLGTNAQHSFFQSLHQSELKIPVDFIGFCKPQINIGDYIHQENKDEGQKIYDGFMANMLAQIDALALGRENKEEPHRNFEGDRPSSVLLFKGSLGAREVGQLLALYEHRVTVKGFLAGINSFDQFGVELGKVMCKELVKKLAVAEGEVEGENRVTNYYVKHR